MGMKVNDEGEVDGDLYGVDEINNNNPYIKLKDYIHRSRIWSNRGAT